MSCGEKQLDLFQCTDMHNVRINHSNMSNALKEVETLVSARQHSFVCFFEANLFHCALRNGYVRGAINQAALVYPDGIAPALGAALCSGERFSRIPGPSFLLSACEYGVSRNWRHFLLGGADGVAEKLAKKLQADFPGIQIAGTCCPPFRTLTEQEESDIKQQIEAAHADLLWVCLGGPKQEFWMQEHLGKIDVPVMLGVGAAFDFHTGSRPWAPVLIRRIGLEWLWRAFSGGYKTFVRNVKCVSHIALVLGKDVLRYKILRHKKTNLYTHLPANADK